MLREIGAETFRLTYCIGAVLHMSIDQVRLQILCSWTSSSSR